MPCPNAPVEFDVGMLELLSSLNNKTELQHYLAPFIPEDNSATVCKPKNWIQGGYDVVRIEKSPPASGAGADNDGSEGTASGTTRIDLFFGQVAKSLTHSLKLRLFANLARAFIDANYEIGSIKIGFIVPSRHMEDFGVPPQEVTSSGQLIHFTVHGSTKKWGYKEEHTQAVVYGLPMQGTTGNTPEFCGGVGSQQHFLSSSDFWVFCPCNRSFNSPWRSICWFLPRDHEAPLTMVLSESTP